MPTGIHSRLTGSKNCSLIYNVFTAKSQTNSFLRVTKWPTGNFTRTDVGYKNHSTSNLFTAQYQLISRIIIYFRFRLVYAQCSGLRKLRLLELVNRLIMDYPFYNLKCNAENVQLGLLQELTGFFRLEKT